jgi:hypothetical protein
VGNLYVGFDKNGMRCTHWWLKKGNRIIDPTESQYTELGLQPPYHLGKGAGFLTSKPSRRAQELMKMVEAFLPPRFRSSNGIYKGIACFQSKDAMSRRYSRPMLTSNH